MSAAAAREALERAYRDPAAIVAGARAAGIPVVRTLGTDTPCELLRAAGILPVRLAPGPAVPTPRADAIMGKAALGARGRRLLEQLVAPESRDIPVLITHADAEQPQIFAALRELARLGEQVPASVHFADLAHIDRPASHAYNHHRLSQLRNWLEDLVGRPIPDEAIADAIDESAAYTDLLAQVAALRSGAAPRLSGTQFLRIAGSAAILPRAKHAEHLRALLADAATLEPLAGRRLYLTGSAHESDALYLLIESLGAIIVGEDHAWGEHRAGDCPSPRADPLDALADPALRVPARVESGARRAARLAEHVAASRAEFVLHLSIEGDEAAPWDVPSVRRAVGDIQFLAARAPLDGSDACKEEIARFLAGDGSAANAIPRRAHAPDPPKGRNATPAGQRSRKSLESVASFSAYQREWFAGVREQVAAGAPFAIVNANSPQEIFRAMGVPFVVNQWWAAIVAAKQQSPRYLGLLRARDFPTDVDPYSAQALAAAFDDDAGQAPWGGLPRPDFVQALASSDATPKLFEHMARATGATPYIYERTIDPRWTISTNWWEDLPDRWDEALEPARIDLLVAELREVIGTLEAKTGRGFSADRFAEVMQLVDEQELYYRRTRDLIARTTPVPISIVDSMPATMVPQWHRGTIWARDAARAFYEEVAQRVADGAAALPNERVRLMWVGRGMWSDMGFYQRWEESHGAVFVWSMYLALAADGYIRRFDRGRDPMRALAARFLTMGDELRMPSWAGPWHVHEARTHAVDGAVALADADPFVLRALTAAGVPVLDLGVDNFNREGEDAAAIDARVAAFIEGPAAARAQERRGR